MELKLTRPDDWHLHLRDEALMHSVLPDTARQFARAIIMPNLRPPVTTTEQALAYRTRILAALPQGMSFDPLMTLYLTDNTSTEEIMACTYAVPMPAFARKGTKRWASALSASHPRPRLVMVIPSCAAER